MNEVKITFEDVENTACFLGFDITTVKDLAVQQPRIFGVIVDATILRLTNEKNG